MRLHDTFVALVLAAFILCPADAGAVNPNMAGTTGAPQRKIHVDFNVLQDLTGCDFKPANGGMEIVAIRKQDGVLPRAGFETGDTVLSIDRMRTTDIDSLISAVRNAQGNTAEVVVIDHRTGNIYTINVAF